MASATLLKPHTSAGFLPEERLAADSAINPNAVKGAIP
jgi:hypothetical protein